MASDKVYIKQLVDKIKGVSGYFLSDERLIRFVKFHSENKNIDDIQYKASCLRNKNMESEFRKAALPEHIVKLDIDPLLLLGEFLTVTKIADVNGSVQREIFLEFASKYCAMHYPDIFPVWNMRSEILIGSFYRRDLVPGNYVQFARYFYKFRKHFGMQNLNFFEIDKLLWIHQKDMEWILSSSTHIPHNTLIHA